MGCFDLEHHVFSGCICGKQLIPWKVEEGGVVWLANMKVEKISSVHCGDCSCLESLAFIMVDLIKKSEHAVAGLATVTLMFGENVLGSGSLCSHGGS